MTYIIYIWRNGDEGGYDVCRSELYNEHLGTKIGEFENANELADLLRQDDPEWFSNDLQTYVTATEMLMRLWVKEEAVVQ